jgi:hypothetical protein
MPTGAEGLARLFKEIARELRGWSGQKEWETVEGDFPLSCTHDGLGHIETIVALRPLYERWEARGSLVLEAGTLDSVARDVRRFLTGT